LPLLPRQKGGEIPQWSTAYLKSFRCPSAPLIYITYYA